MLLLPAAGFSLVFFLLGDGPPGRPDFSRLLCFESRQFPLPNTPLFFVLFLQRPRVPKAHFSLAHSCQPFGNGTRHSLSQRMPLLSSVSKKSTQSF
jgi:hypothetical protein